MIAAMGRLFGVVLLAAWSGLLPACSGLRPEKAALTWGHGADGPGEVLLESSDEGPMWWTVPLFTIGCASCFWCCWRRTDDVEDFWESLPDIPLVTCSGLGVRLCGGCGGAVAVYLALFLVPALLRATGDLVIATSPIPNAVDIMSAAIEDLEKRNEEGTVSLVNPAGETIGRKKTAGVSDLQFTMGYYKFNFLKAHDWDTEMVCPTSGWLCMGTSMLTSPFTHRFSCRGAVLLRDGGELVGVVVVTGGGPAVEHEIAAAAAQAAGFGRFGEKPADFNIGDQPQIGTEPEVVGSVGAAVWLTMSIFAMGATLSFGCCWGAADDVRRWWISLPDITGCGCCVRLSGGLIGSIAIYVVLFLVPALLRPAEELMVATPSIPKAVDIMSAAIEDMEQRNLDGTVSLVSPAGETIGRQKTAGASNLQFTFGHYKFNFLKANDWDTDMVCPTAGYLCMTTSLLTSPFTHRLSRRGAVLLREEGKLVGVLSATGGGAAAEHATASAAARAAGYSKFGEQSADFNFGEAEADET